MRVFANPARFGRAAGSPPLWSGSDPQWLRGPFLVQGTLANASVLAVDLTQRGTWFSDKRVSSAYGISTTSDTARMEAVLQLWGVKILLATQTATVNALASLAKLLAAATIGTSTSPYLSVNIGGIISGIQLLENLSAGAEQFQATQAAAADGYTGLVRPQSKYRVPGGTIRANLKSDKITIATDAAPALGADVLAQFVLYGALTPTSAWEGRSASFFPGSAACMSDDGIQIGSPVDAEIINNLDGKMEPLSPTKVDALSTLG